MLAFFYKHQKKFIGIVIAVVCISGLGVGWGRFSRGEGSTESTSCRIMFTTASGKKYLQKDFLAMKKFLAHEAYPFTGNPRAWNFINEGLLTDYFLTTRMGEKLFLQVYASGEKLFSKEKMYQPYRRFDAPFISSEEVWKSSAPQLLEIFKIFQQIENPISKEGFLARVKLFLEERRFPHYVLRQMLEYRRQMFALPPDQILSQGKDLRLFGYNTIQDWFGDPYLSAAVEVLIRFIDEQKKVLPRPSRQEARDDFYDKARSAYSKINKNPEFSIGFEEFVNSYFQFLEISEFEFLNMYRDILLCKKAILTLRGSIAFDFQPLNKFFIEGQDSIQVEFFKLPKDYCFKTRQELKAFETYLKLVSVPKSDCLDIPQETLPIDKIKSTEPRLVGRRFSIGYQSVALQDLGTKVPMVEVIHWQQNAEHFQEILEKFPDAETCQSYKDFQQLKPGLRDKISLFTRKEILRAHPERILESLKQLPIENKEILLAGGMDYTLPGIVDGQQLAQVLLENEVIGLYSQDLERYYTFVVNHSSEKEEILSYQEVLRRDLASKLVASHGHLVDMDCIVSALRKRYPNEEGTSLWQRRLFKVVEDHRFGRYVSGSCSWNLERSLKTFSRGDKGLPEDFERLFSMKIGEYSPVLINLEEGPCYYQCLSHLVYDRPARVDKLFLAKSQLDEELIGSYMERFIEQGVLR
ncbi:chlamydial GcvH-like protein upstream region protein [Chlamydia serpentis]|uniref:Chlamydial GcvH-like protein upstream region protein n=1 Tax=Chlamydia serpentis TaxID=1967782 RepID=A0A2R8FAW8_9CHLA|nr:hypothetical protein [Chlamydia serpentis]SPN73569.1 chlamydial GcvH-like protein upstream region protein [Chlamydia serpentis]